MHVYFLALWSISRKNEHLLFIFTMTHLTSEQLQHLCDLVALHLTPEEQGQLLPQLEHIITMVSQLPEVDGSNDEGIKGNELLQSTQSTVPEADFPKHFFDNVHHPIEGNRVQLKTKLTKE